MEFTPEIMSAARPPVKLRAGARRTTTGNNARLDLRGNRNGLYLCTVAAGNQVVTEPLVLLR